MKFKKTSTIIVLYLFVFGWLALTFLPGVHAGFVGNDKNTTPNSVLINGEKETYYYINGLSSEPYYSKQWYLEKIKAPAAWQKANKSPNVIVALVDSGVQLNHPDLAQNIWQNIKEIPDNGVDDDHNGFIDDINGWDFTENNNNPNPKFVSGFTDNGIMHGTVVAGIIAAQGNNNIGVSGVTWEAKIMPLKALNDRGEGKASDVIRAIDYAIKNGADIINLSFTGHEYSRSLEEAIKRAYNAGVIVVAAAGNEELQGQGNDLQKKPLYPVCYDGDNGENMVIGVAALDALDQKANFSGYGKSCVDIAAPGVSIFSTSIFYPNESFNGKYYRNYYDGYWSGTSMATPIISGAIALAREINPELKPQELKTILLNTTDDINKLNPALQGMLGRGRINLELMIDVISQKTQAYDYNLLLMPAGSSDGKLTFSNMGGKEFSKLLIGGKKISSSPSFVAGDVDGDGNDELIVGAEAGVNPKIFLYDLSGKLLRQFFAYDKNFYGGVNVAIGDLDGDGRDEIITGPGVGGGPHIRVFSSEGKLLRQFFAYDKNFRGGVNVTVGDLDGDGRDEIITGPGKGGGPQVKIFNYYGKLIGEFSAYEKSFRGGVNVASGNLIKIGRSLQDEIVISPVFGKEPLVKIFNSHGETLSSFLAFDRKFKGGVNITLGDINKDALQEIIVGAGAGGAPHVRAFSFNGSLLGGFYAFSEKYDQGVKVGSVKLLK